MKLITSDLLGDAEDPVVTVCSTQTGLKGFINKRSRVNGRRIGREQEGCRLGGVAETIETVHGWMW